MIRMRPASCIILGLTWAGYLGAQQPSLTGPVEAYTFDAPTRSLRAVIGLPGGATFGPVLRDNLDFASIAPLRNYGLEFQGGLCLLISGLGSARPATRTLTGISAQPEGIVWSGDGSLAILYSRAGNWLQVVSGFPDAPAAQPRVDGPALGGPLSSVAAAAKGNLMAAGVSGPNGGILESTDGLTFTRVASLADPAALAFSGDGTTLFALDGNTPQVITLSLSGEGNQTIPLPGLVNPVAIQSLTDSQNRELLYVAAASDHMLRIVDAQSGQMVSDVPVSFQPTSLSQFGNNSFVAAARSQAVQPLWLFAATPQRAYFVPAVQLRQANHRAADAGRAR